jgi:hypothetical protein
MFFKANYIVVNSVVIKTIAEDIMKENFSFARVSLFLFSCGSSLSKAFSF